MTTKFQKGKSGNPKGKPVGAKDKRTELRELLKPHSEKLIQKAVDLAMEGDQAALKMCLDRICPALKSQAPLITLPLTATDEAGRASEVFQAMIQGEVPPDTGRDIISSIAAILKAKEVSEIEKRVITLEQLVTGDYS